MWSWWGRGSEAEVSDMKTTGALAGWRIGVTAARRAEEQISLLERRGALVHWAPAVSVHPDRIDEDGLRAATEEMVSAPVDMFIATTGIGVTSWFEAAGRWGLLPTVLETLGRAEILARGPKSVGALRGAGLRELWVPESECFDDVLAHLRGRDLRGLRIVVQEHGQSLSTVASALRSQGADVQVVTVYRIEGPEDPAPLLRLVQAIAALEIDAVTFTSAPAAASVLEVAAALGLRDEVIAAFQAEVLAVCVGPVTAAALELWGVPTVQPARSGLAAMVRALEVELPLRRAGQALSVAGHALLLHGETVSLDGIEMHLPPGSHAILHALAVNPGHVVSRRELLACLPSGQATTEHAVEVAVARLRAVIGTRLVQTVVKRGYRLAVG